MSINIREPVVKGMFYPAAKDPLQKMISTFLVQADPPVNEKKSLLGLIVPHAGYVYSGPCAAYSYKLLKSVSVDTVILLGPSHYTMLEGSALWPDGIYRTPLGDVAIDEETCQYLLKNHKVIEDYKIAHIQEHSLEVQLPFLQYVLKNKFQLVPIVVGNPNYDYTTRLARALHDVMEKRPKHYLILASSDLSHYHSDDVAKRMDRLVIDLIHRNLPEELARLIESGKGEACGIGPILTLLSLSKSYAHPHAEILNVTNSGETSGDKTRVVGYMSAAVYV
ncbi:MAG: AmmeMemoRadiSam system protein B [bacterium]|nr:AmmeMemoRadiSam system protein B [bacterium]